MSSDRPMNPLEMLAYILSKQIEDHEVVYIGTGLPMVAAILAKKTHAPNITFVYESGGQDPEHLEMPWSVGGPMTWRKSPIIMEMAYSFGQAATGLVDKGFLGFAQIDMYGNANTHQIGTDYLNPKVRLTGSGGNNDVSSLVHKLIYVGLQDPNKFVKKVDFITSPGWLDGGDSRKKAGLLNDGPMAVITSAGVYDFEPETKRMRIKSLHPGVSPELAQMASGFELLKPEGEIPVTEKPSKEILEILRNEVDPNGLFISMPS
ncbi:MAG TPA: CoA-transferase [Spirochaetota bacterium]|jgi:acyl CoA:acetate/3-ketoacid CoA transferase beta subunit|nr:MAG: Glutaconate CoA-transferase subunit B [Spirochaetes bacterium ADurb.Bin218]HOK01342.1 CoA-transferase [Spirochaetota bacterium]HOK93496.1 CoA-transferase [Spirochaetota bacterium]HON16244.1 CoA-transferase [Spirochaetota bacterium]HPD78593.1 CoA-transferase [Spirochaetota bacterium]